MRLLIAVMMLSATAAGAAEPPQSHPEWDAEYTRLIREATTGPQFMTPLVDHLPAAVGVPTPLDVNGYIAGAPDHLSYASQIHAYMRALAAASPRVEVLSIGPTEEGREMIAVAVADEETIASLDRYRDITRRLADPRAIGEDEAQRLIGEGKPIYHLTGGLHSPETGSPEMLMELAYRLAVEDSPLINSIRSNVITLITPVLEVDGRERIVDTWRWHQAHPDDGALLPVYWGHYVVHDNNRDATGRALDLTRNIERLYFAWHPQVMHDLHESIPFLYISTGTGPYNAWLDPLMIDQWERMASNEVQHLTGMGLPGVWTHGFYDGWGPSYLFWIAMGHNSLGRFYETFGNMLPTTEDRVVRGMSDRDWYRPNPPLPQVRWSLRNNVNYQQSGVLTALAWTAEHRLEVLEQFWRLGQRAVAKATTEGPAAYVFPSDQPRLGQLRDLLAKLTEHGIEVSVAEQAITLKNEWPPREEKAAESTAGDEAAAGAGEDEETSGEEADVAAKEEKPAEQELSFPAGSFVIRMDQPYSRFADTLLDTQYVRGSDRLYDDAGWTVGIARNLEWQRVVNGDVLAVPMHRWQGGPLIPAKERPKLDGAVVLAIAAHADTDLVRLRFALPDLAMRVTEEEAAGTTPIAAGTVLVMMDGADRKQVARALAGLDLEVQPLASAPEVSSHALSAPRIALLHSWLDTESEGWYRLALEDLGVPYDYISTQDVAAEPDLGAHWDVIIFPPAGGDPVRLVNGLPPGPPLPWQKSELTPNLGVLDSTDDMRPGLGLSGVSHLARFVEGGGLLITVGDTARLAVEYGLARFMSVVDTAKVKVDGSLLQAEVTADAGPVAMGYGDSLPVYFAHGPVFKVGVMPPRRPQDGQRPSGRGGKDDPDVPQARPYVRVPPEPTPAPGEKGFQLPENLGYFYKTFLPQPKDRPRVIVAFPEKPDEILLSGKLEGGAELAGAAVVVDSPLGEGHILLFGNNPMWRSTTQGTYSLVMNAVMNHDHLDLGWPPDATEKQEAQ